MIKWFKNLIGYKVVVMTENQYKEWREFEDNVFLVYENEAELKTDFPNAMPRSD